MSTVGRTWLEIVTGEKRGLVPTLLRAALLVASVPYSLVMRVRNLLYDRGWLPVHRAGVPVVVVGNLTVGGTGKTPAVEYLARFFRQNGCKIAILSRGYGASAGHSDEGRVLQANLDDVPQLEGADRVALAHIAVEELERDLLLLDDGFQHRRLHRDCDIVLVDATQPWGRVCLPGGLLREPRSGLHRADAVIITRADQVAPQRLEALREAIASFIPGKPLAIARHAALFLGNTHETLPPAALQGQDVAALCGIGNPSGFLSTLAALGANVVDQLIFPDHHPYQREDVACLEAWARELPEGAWLVTTQKDWVKLHIDQLGGKPLWFLRIALEVSQGREALESALLHLLNQPPGTTPERDLRSSADPSSVGDSSVCKDVYDSAKACSV